MHIIQKTRISTELLADLVDLVDELLFIKNKPEQAYGLVVVCYPDYTRLGIKEFFTTLDDISVAPDGTSINTQTKLSILNFLTYFKNFSVKDIDRFRYFKQEKEVIEDKISSNYLNENLLNYNIKNTSDVVGTAIYKSMTLNELSKYIRGFEYVNVLEQNENNFYSVLLDNFRNNFIYDKEYRLIFQYIFNEVIVHDSRLEDIYRLHVLTKAIYKLINN